MFLIKKVALLIMARIKIIIKNFHRLIDMILKKQIEEIKKWLYFLNTQKNNNKIKFSLKINTRRKDKIEINKNFNI